MLRPQVLLALVPVFMGAILLVFLSGELSTQAELLVPGNGEQCGEPRFTNEGKNDKGHTFASWQSCIKQQCGGGAGQVGKCANDPGKACQRFCMGDTTAEGKIINCCSQVVQGNGCTRVAGKCDGQLPEKKPEAGGAGEQKPGEEKPGQGGEPPKLPEIPKPPPGGGGGGEKPPAANEECDTNQATATEDAPCPKSTGGVGEYLNSIFGGEGDDAPAESMQSRVSDAAKKLSSFLFGTESDTTTSDSVQTSANAQNPITPIGSDQKLTPQVVQARPIGSATGDIPSAVVTGFGSQGAGGQEQSGIMKAIGETLSGIGVTLRNLLSSFAL